MEPNLSQGLFLGGSHLIAAYYTLPDEGRQLAYCQGGLDGHGFLGGYYCISYASIANIVELTTIR